MFLADLGADVIKVEPPDGDDTRGWGPPFWGPREDGRSAYFASVNRNKRSIVVDLKHDAGRDVLDILAERSDLLFHNYRPDTAARLGLGAERLASRHPSLITAVVAGFPGDGSEQRRPAYDLLAQAVSGLMSVTGEAAGPPTKVGVAMLDLLSGLQVGIGALASLVGRGSGRGAVTVEVSLVEAGVTSLVNVLANHLATGTEPTRQGNAHPNIAPYQSFSTAEGEIVIAVGNDAQFGRLLDVLGLVDADGSYATNADRVQRRSVLIPWLADAIRGRQRDELVRCLDGSGVPSGPVQTVSEAVTEMERAHAGGWVEHVDGMMLAPDPIRVDGRRTPLRLPPPRLAEHTEQVLAESGMDDAEIRRLVAAGVVGAPPVPAAATAPATE
jgi:crotonobetainyl-CoA:carnitine CoA-transferase CaiB-like acyl-CoA transferase